MLMDDQNRSSVTELCPLHLVIQKILWAQDNYSKIESTTQSY